MQFLTCHPSLQPPAGLTLTAGAEAAGDGSLRFTFRLTGDPAALAIPAPAESTAADGLWQTTCCEAFVAGDVEAYHEFNFSPSSRWAAYRFTSYRQRDEAWQPAVAPLVEFTALADGFQLAATVPAALLPAGRRLRLGLTTVVETADGGKTYWALTHVAQQPDFHPIASFTLALERT